MKNLQYLFFSISPSYWEKIWRYFALRLDKLGSIFEHKTENCLMYGIRFQSRYCCPPQDKFRNLSKTFDWKNSYNYPSAIHVMDIGRKMNPNKWNILKILGLKPKIWENLVPRFHEKSFSIQKKVYLKIVPLSRIIHLRFWFFSFLL